MEWPWRKIFGGKLRGSMRFKRVGHSARGAYLMLLTMLVDDDGYLSAGKRADGGYEPILDAEVAEEILMTRAAWGRAKKKLISCGLMKCVKGAEGVYFLPRFSELAGRKSFESRASNAAPEEAPEPQTEPKANAKRTESERKPNQKRTQSEHDPSVKPGLTTVQEEEGDRDKEGESESDARDPLAQSASQTRGHGDPLGRPPGPRPWREVEPAMQAGHVEATGQPMGTWRRGAWRHDVCRAVGAVSGITPGQIQAAFRDWMRDRKLLPGSEDIRYWPEHAQSWCLWAAGQGAHPRKSKRAVNAAAWLGGSPEVPQEVVSADEIDRVAEKARTQPRPWARKVGA